MANSLFKLDINSWQPAIDADSQKSAITALEKGKVLFLPNLPFELEGFEQRYVDDNSILKLDSKSVKFSPQTKRLWGLPEEQINPHLTAMLERYSNYARNLIENLLPKYKANMTIGNSSFRPAEIQGRKQSPRQDDTRLHVDAFPSRPNGGKRILRVFTNAHPGEHPRTWRTGEAFADVAAKFVPQIAAPLPGSAKILQILKITKSPRTRYDHYMLQIHDRMKMDDEYQRTADQETVEFPPGSSWIVFTDQVSHAAMSGRYAFEQTFTLPVEAMADPEQSPFKILEKLI